MGGGGARLQHVVEVCRVRGPVFFEHVSNRGLGIAGDDQAAGARVGVDDPVHLSLHRARLYSERSAEEEGLGRTWASLSPGSAASDSS